MPSAKTKRLISSGVVGAVWVAAITFAAWMLAPRVREALSLYQQVGDAEALLDTRVKADLKPSMGVTMRYQDIKGQMEKEAEACAYEYLRHNECLNRKILESWRKDPYDLAGKFLKVKRELGDKAGNPDFLELGKLDDWEKEERGKPREEDFGEIEKRTCIAAVLVELLTSEPATVIQLMSIGDPTPGAQAPRVPPAEWAVVRHNVYPVDAQFTTQFSSLGRLLNQIIIVPPSAINIPCMTISRIKLEAADAKGAGTVKVELMVDVYDFFKVEKAS